MKQIPLSEWLHKQSQDIVALDARSPGEYAQGHVPGALNLPLLNNEERHLVGLCYKEIRILSCDSCYKKILNKTLNEKYWGWTKIDSKTYFSKFRKHLMLNLQVDNPTSFEIRQVAISRKEFKHKIK